MIFTLLAILSLDIPRAFNFLIFEPLFKAHTLKELFHLFWSQDSFLKAWIFLDKWILDATTTGIKKLKKIADVIDDHRCGLLNYFKHRITKCNSRVQQQKVLIIKLKL